MAGVVDRGDGVVVRNTGGDRCIGVTRARDERRVDRIAGPRDGAVSVVADVGAGVGERAAGLGHELPVVTAWLERQAQHAVGVAIADLAIWFRSCEAVVAATAGAGHELAHAAPRVGNGTWGLRREA